MAKWLEVILALSGITVLSSCIVEPGEKPVPEPIKPSAAPMIQGRVGMTRLYADNCAKCHGQDGEGGGGGTRTLLTEAKFDQNLDKPFFDAIKHGVPDAGMDAYGETMSDEQIWGLVVHIRELQGKALRAQKGSPKPTNGVYTSKHHKFRIEPIVAAGKGLDVPWAADWLSDGRMLVTNRSGTLHLVSKSGELAEVQGSPPVVDNGQGGLMEVAVHPEYSKNGWIYLGFNDPAKDGANRRAGMTKIVRGKLAFEGGTPKWTGQQTIFEAPASSYTPSGVHFGCRIVFDGKGHIFFSIGERGNANLAQDLTKPNGKVYRVKEDGGIPDDNPFVGGKAQGHLPAIWSYGHRNPQGLVLDLQGRLWDTEHGPRGGDEVNRIQKGKNYGWPLVAFSINYSDAPFRTPWPKPGQDIAMPVFRWIPSTGACGLDVVRGNSFSKWKGDLLAGGLVGENVDRFRIVDDKIVEHEEIIHGMGRVRDIAVGPDGYVYIVFNGPDRIVRLIPAD